MGAMYQDGQQDSPVQQLTGKGFQGTHRQAWRSLFSTELWARRKESSSGLRATASTAVL